MVCRMSSGQLQLIKEYRIKITDAHKRIRLLEEEIREKVSQIHTLQEELGDKELSNAKYSNRYGWTLSKQ